MEFTRLMISNDMERNMGFVLISQFVAWCASLSLSLVFHSLLSELSVIPIERVQFMHASVIIYSFHYLLDPKVAEQVSKHMSKDSIVVFDEAHNIGSSSPLSHSLQVKRADEIMERLTDNVCIESLSIDLTRPMLDTAARSVETLTAKIEE